MDIALALRNLKRLPGQRRMKIQLWDVICAAVLCVILTLGLWPFHSPESEVAWLVDRNGLQFGSPATVMSSGAFRIADAENEASLSIEVWLQPLRIWDSGTLLAFYTPGSPSQFSLRQSQVDLELTNTARRYVGNVFRRRRPVFLTITSGMHGTTVYRDGVLFSTQPRFRLFPKEFVGRLVLGDAPQQPDSWSGDLRGLALYGGELTAAQVLRHYETWTRLERPEISGEERNVALYLFNERAGNVAHDQAGSGVNLEIPKQYVVLDKIFLEPFWKEFNLSRSYWESAVKNIVGFIPFGFCFCACLSAHKTRRTALVTVILGTLTSLTIEILQAYLPTRDSGTTDLFTNTFGTYLGVVACRTVSPILAARFPWLPFVASPPGALR